MRPTPAAQPEAEDAGLRGSNQSGVRDHNERIVLTLIQRHPGLAAAEIARRSGLSAQTASVIIRKLEADGLLTRGAPIRGKVGKPLTPMALDPAGLSSMGMIIGRRASEIAVIDLAGRLTARREAVYPYPTPRAVMAFAERALPELLQELGPGGVARLPGIGVSAPFELWNWLHSVNAPAAEMDRWRDFDVAGAVGRLSGLEVVFQNDATSACTAEHLFGRGREFADYAYFFIGSFIGGGLVLNGTVHPGRSGNAGAFGSLPVPDAGGGATQLIRHASIYTLERAIVEDGLDPRGLWIFPRDWTPFERQVGPWIAHTARHLALAAVAACAVIDFEAVLIDGAFPEGVRARLVAETRRALALVDTQGIAAPRIEEAAVGRNARVVGSAALPILSKYLLSQSTFR